MRFLENHRGDMIPIISDNDVEQVYVQKERIMYVNSSNNDAQYHLLGRISNIGYEHKQKLAKQFHVYTVYPEDEKEAKEWFDKGNFHWFDTCLGWGPAPDQDGYDKACDKMWDAKTKAIDIVMVKTDEDARLKALHDFESATFH